MKIIDKNKTIFLNIDTQRDFMYKDGLLYIENSEEIIPTLKEVTDFASDNDIRVLNTCDWHYEDSEELSDDPDFATTFPNHCMVDSEGALFIPQTNPDNPYIIDWAINLGLEYLPNRNIVIRKDKFDLFTGNPNTNRIVDILKNTNIDSVVIYGVSGDICVSYAVNGFLERGFEVILLKDAIYSLSKESLENSLLIWNKNDKFSYINFDFSIS